MKLKVLVSGSKANSYILENEKEALVIEAGVPFKELIRHVDHRKIVGCLVSHEHKDHSAYVNEYRRYGMQTFTPYEHCEDLEYISQGKRVGNFFMVPFENYHNVQCYGYFINHKKCGKIVFATDTGYIDRNFSGAGISHWLIECNYSTEILDQRVEEGFNPHLADRIVKDHMSLETCKDFFSANDLSRTRNIVLLHLSDRNSNAEQFQREIHELTKKDTYIAEKGLEIDLSLCPI